MESMIEHTAGIKIVASIGKGAMLILIALGFAPVFELAIQQVQGYIFLSPFAKEFLDEVKTILSVIVPAFVLVHILYKIKKLKNKE